VNVKLTVFIQIITGLNSFNWDAKIVMLYFMLLKYLLRIKSNLENIHLRMEIKTTQIASNDFITNKKWCKFHH